MARIREIKPEFFLDENLAELGLGARLLFIGLWTLCDREGRLEDRPARIKAQVFPYGSEDVETMLGELAARGFIVRYEIDSRRYIQVRSFSKHQRPHPKEAPSRFPPPPNGDGNGKPGNSTASREKVGNQGDPSGGSMGTWAHGRMEVGREGSGEGSGEEPTYLPPPVERAERALNGAVNSLQLRLGSLIAQLSEHPNSRRMVPDWSRAVTSYDRQDGTKVKGVADWRTLQSIDRLERSIADAEWWLAEMNKGVQGGTL